MSTRRLAAASTAVALLLVSTARIGADEKSLLIVLERTPARPAAVSASGAVVVGGLTPGGFYWMPTTGVVFAGGVMASGVSRDGRTIVGEARDSRGIRQAAIWLRAAEWRLLGSFPNAAVCDGSFSSAADVSANGEVVVGDADNGCTVTHAFRWSESTGMVDLGSSVDGRPTVARGVSGDGAVVVGSQTDATGFLRGVRWVGNRQEMIPGPVGYVSTATAANHDGSIVVGRICRPGFDIDQSAWMWTSAGGTTCLAPPARRVSPGALIVGEAEATSDDGKVIGGSQNVGGSDDSNAVLWLDGQGVFLKDFLRANGIPDAFEGWPNTGSITGISPDGRVLVGWGASPTGFRTYIVVLGSSRMMPS